MTDEKPVVNSAAMEMLQKLSRDFRLPTNRRYAAVRLETALDALTVVDELPAREPDFEAWEVTHREPARGRELRLCPWVDVLTEDEFVAGSQARRVLCYHAPDEPDA